MDEKELAGQSLEYYQLRWYIHATRATNERNHQSVVCHEGDGREMQLNNDLLFQVGDSGSKSSLIQSVPETIVVELNLLVYTE